MKTAQPQEEAAAGLLESDLEAVVLDWLGELGYAVEHGPDLGPGGAKAERVSYESAILLARLEAALRRLNPKASGQVIETALQKIQALGQVGLVASNRAFHKMLIDGITLETRTADGRVTGEGLRLVDFQNPEKNDWLAVNQFTFVENRVNRRPDVLVFVNGLPLALFELKNAADEGATVWSAFKQVETYKAQLPSLMQYNEILVLSDGLDALAGCLSSDRERFLPWRTIDTEALAPKGMLKLEVLVRGMFDKRRFLDLVRHFVVFEDDGAQVTKKIAAYHQFHAVAGTLASTQEAAARDGSRKGGVVWHTQGSGKSLTMVFFAGRLVLDPDFQNPTIVVLTDRNDLDDQLFGTFSRCRELLRDAPVQAKDRGHLRQLLQRASGGIVFTTIHKFLPDEKGDKHPVLTDRRNVVVLADEAHRSQYDFIDGFAKHLHDALPQATHVGFTGTPLELADKNTRAIFGNYVSVYDIQRAVEDKATVPIYYESRLARLELKESERPRLDREFEEVTEDEEQQGKERIKTKWAALAAIVGAEKRIKTVAKDIVDHFERRQEGMPGKAMVVCMSRPICMDLHDAIRALRPDWYSTRDDEGTMKVVMTGNASEGPRVAEHSRNKPRREALAKRFKDPKDSLKLVIVRDMWLTGFDAPCMHTMYLDKPMRGHGLMQAIARVNRVFSDKPGGLIVDYLGLADQLKQALANYTEHDRENTAIPEEMAIATMKERHEICTAMFHGFDWSAWKTGKPVQKLGLLPNAQEHILKQEHGKERFRTAIRHLGQAFALAATSDEAKRIRDDVAFFQAVSGALGKSDGERTKDPELLDAALQQLVSRAISSNEVIDLFQAAGIQKPDISILSDSFLAEVQHMPQKNLAVDLMRRLLSQEIKVRFKRNLVESRSFTALLEQSILRYKNRALETAQVVEELIGLAKQMREVGARGKRLGLTDAELAFYDALGTNDSAVRVLGDATLSGIAREVADAIRRGVTIDWTAKESVRAELRVLVKRILKRNGYPPDKQEQAVETVLKQAELVAAEWAELPAM